MVFEELKMKQDVYRDMEDCDTNELRLWIIQELSCVDSTCWWLIEDGIEMLKEKMRDYKQ